MGSSRLSELSEASTLVLNSRLRVSPKNIEIEEERPMSTTLVDTPNE